MKSLIGIYKEHSRYIEMYEISPLCNIEICIDIFMEFRKSGKVIEMKQNEAII